MRVFKYLAAGVLVLSATAPVMAQDVESDVEAITKKVVAANGDPEAVKDDVKVFMKTYKKNGVAIAGLGRAYLDCKNLTEAQTYAEKAIAVDKDEAEGYILAGDIAVLNDDPGTAASWYQNATMSDPQEAAGYVKYARIYQKIDPDGAVAMLEKLREVKPDYPVDAAAGYMYSASGRLKTAIECYNKVSNINTLDDYILYDYTITAYVLEQYDKALNLSLTGIKNYPEYSPFNRLAFYCNNKLEDYNAAAVYAERWFNKNDTVKFSANDYIFYGDVLYNLDRTDEAIEAYKQAQVVDPERNDVYKLISDVYVKQKNYDKAVEAYNTYIDLLGSNANANIYRGLADIYVEESETDDQAAKIAALRKADGVYADMETKFPYAVEYATWMRSAIHYQINTDVKSGEAKPYYEKYISLVESNTERTESQTKKLATSYNYLAVYYIQNDNLAKSKEYAQKLLEIKPEDETALQIMAIE